MHYASRYLKRCVSSASLKLPELRVNVVIRIMCTINLHLYQQPANKAYYTIMHINVNVNV